MAFVCPMCKERSLDITHSIELPPERYDELTLQVVGCNACGFRGAAIYEESRQGSSDRWHHSCFAAPAEVLDALAALIESCPKQSERNCSCDALKTIGRRDPSGKWVPPVPVDSRDALPMK